MTVLNKDQLRDLIAEAKDITKKDATEYIDDVFETFGSVITDYAVGFRFGDIGTFDVVEVEEKERTYRNPQTQEPFTKTVPAHYALKFKVNKRTKDALIELKASE